MLGRIGGKKSLAGVRAALGEQDEKVKDAALHAMIEWPDALVADDLLALAKSSANETHQVLATRGYIRVCAIRGARPDAETARLLVAGLRVARRPEEKWQALGGAGRNPRHPGSPGSRALHERGGPSRRGRRGRRPHRPRYLEQSSPGRERRDAEGDRGLQNDGLKRDAKEALDRAEQKLAEAKPK